MKNSLLRPIAAGLGFAALGTLGLAAAATAAENDGSVDISVEIESLVEPGVLALTIAGDSVQLEENGSDPDIRRFTGDLPEVTVTDTRTADEIPDDAAWHVLASTTDLVGTDGQPAIPAENLGWTPAIVGDDSDGIVFAGEAEPGVLDGGVGLADQALLYSTITSEGVAPGTWSATAGLELSTEPTVAAGNYTSTITISLFE